MLFISSQIQKYLTIMKLFFLSIFRWYFSKFPVRKGKMPLLNFISWMGLTNKVKTQKTFDEDIKINLDLEDWIQKQIYFFGRYEVEKKETLLWKKILKEGQTIFDIGANIGYYSLMASKRIGNGKIYAFEPVKQTFERLTKNVKLNNFKNIKLNNLAVSNEVGTVDIYVANSKNTGTSSITKHMHFNGDKQTVKSVTIDHFIKSNNIEAMDIVKIDVEGAEMMVIEGMEKSLRKFNPIVMIELIDERLKAAGSSIKEAYDFFEKLNYKPYQLDRHLEMKPSEKYREGSLVIFKK